MAAALPFMELAKQVPVVYQKNKSTLWLWILIIGAIVIVLAVLGKLGKWFSFLKPTNIAGKAVGLDHRVMKSSTPLMPDGTQLKWGDILGGPFALMKHMKKKKTVK